MTWKCTTCDRVFDSIPEDAVLLTRGKFNRVIVYRFANGVVHGVRKIKPVNAEHLHRRWHKTAKVVDCGFCFPPEPPKEDTELLQEVLEVLTELPQSAEPEVAPEIDSDEIQQPVTTMAAAFRNFKS